MVNTAGHIDERGRLSETVQRRSERGNGGERLLVDSPGANA